MRHLKQSKINDKRTRAHTDAEEDEETEVAEEKDEEDEEVEEEDIEKAVAGVAARCSLLICLLAFWKLTTHATPSPPLTHSLPPPPLPGATNREPL